MTPKQASKVIGCSPQQVRHLIRRGLLPATRRKSPNNQYGYEYIVTQAAAERARTAKYRRRPPNDTAA